MFFLNLNLLKCKQKQIINGSWLVALRDMKYPCSDWMITKQRPMTLSPRLSLFHLEGEMDVFKLSK